MTVIKEHRVEVENGKYTFVVPSNDHRVHILRHGESWYMPEVDQPSHALHAIMCELDAARVVIQAARELVRNRSTREPDERLVEALTRHAALTSDCTPPSPWTGGAPSQPPEQPEAGGTPEPDEASKSVRDYLDALAWDQEPRIDRWLIDYAGAPDTEYVRAVSRRVLVAAVRRARQPGCRLDEMLVLEGVRGSGKTAALRVLAGGDGWFTDDLRLGERDILESTAGKWIVEVSELSRLGQDDVAALKACLSRQHDEGRGSTTRVARVPRQFVIVGTTSVTDEYLPDATGNRRFLSVRVQRFDLDRLRADRDQLWAEAAVVEATGEPIGEIVRSACARVPILPTPEQVLSAAHVDERSEMTFRDLIRAIELHREGHGDEYLDVPVILRVEDGEGDQHVGSLYDLEIDSGCSDEPALMLDAAQDSVR